MHLTLTFKIKKERKQFQHARNFNFQIYVLNFASMESKSISTNTSIKYFWSEIHSGFFSTVHPYIYSSIFVYLIQFVGAWKRYTMYK